MCVFEAHSSYYRVTSNKNDKIVHTYSRIHESEFYTVTDLYGTLNLLLDVATLCGSYKKESDTIIHLLPLVVLMILLPSYTFQSIN